MKTFMTTAAIIAALTMPALAEGDDPSTKQGEAKGNVKSSTSINTPPAGMQAGGSAMGQGQVLPRRSTTGSGGADELTQETQGTASSPGNKTGVSGGADGGSGGSGSGGSGGGSGSR